MASPPLIQPKPEQLPSHEEMTEEVKMEQFAMLYAMGAPIPEALASAGYTTKNPILGYRLLHHPEVVRIVDETRAWRNEKIAHRIDDVIAQLQRDRDFAYRMSNPAAAIQATSMIGRILGALEPGQRTPAKITITWGGDEEESTLT